MSQVKFESKQTRANAPVESVWGALSDLENLNRLRSLIPEDKVKDLTIEQDVIRFKIDGLAKKVGVRVVDREVNKTLKFALEDVPVEAFFWIQTVGVSESDTRLKLTVKADMPAMFRMMLEKKLQTGLDQAADILAQLPYQEWEKKQ